VKTDTIAAIATALGPSGVAIVRVSGPAAGGVLRALCGEASPEPRVASLLAIRHPRDGRLLDRGLVTRFVGPDSYTGEDVVEFSCHGGYLTPRLVLEACLAAGAREAQPGEFTRRAYLNGRLDLIQAEAVVDLVEGRSPRLRQAALHQLERGLSDRVADLRGRLVGLEARLVHHIDFPDEDDQPVPIEEIAAEAEAVAAALGALARTAPEGELLREGAVTVLAGVPNAGKSSLFNALLGVERAIVTEVPGTTRDALDAVVSLDGFPFRLVDTAGLRESDDPVERIGVEVAGRWLEAADVVLLCVPARRAPSDEERRFVAERAEVPVVLVRTQADLADGVAAGGEVPGAAASVTVSAVDGRGLDELRAALPRLVFAGLVEAGSDAPVLTRARQRAAVEAAREHVCAFARALAEGVPADLAATHLRPAESELEALLGTIDREEVLDRVFADFCVGK